MVALGLRYFTVQVRDCVAEDRQRRAVTEAAAPMTGNGPTVAVCFPRPDGNWIEIIQRN